MPIFHDHDDSPLWKSPLRDATAHREQRVGYSGNGFGGTYADGLRRQDSTDPTFHSDTNTTVQDDDRRPSVLNRVELIERLKRGNSPAWPPRQNNGTCTGGSPEPRSQSRSRPSTPLLATEERKTSRPSTPEQFRTNASAGIEIERPRSALHSGDFREKKEEAGLSNGSTSSILSTSPVVPWHHSFPAAAFPSTHSESQFSFGDTRTLESRPTVRSRAASQSSFSSSFVFLPPTSPLVQQSNNADLDFSSRPASRQASRSPERNNRRHTFSPHSFQTYKSAQMVRSASGTPAARHLKREGTFPYQAHQPRRSLTSLNQIQSHSTPHTPLVQSRRPSFSSESPLQHAPMVGSYEESILRGRMSTTPSRPLNFVAQIGVLGKGQCKANLRCPPHVTVPFPAVFYSYSSGNGRITDNSPSPYVGFIDLENNLSRPDETSESSKRRRRHQLSNPYQDDVSLGTSPRDEHLPQSKEGIRRREKMKRRSTSPKSPPGGSYRIPQQGQLQIIIKNPNKTAVKLFLVPYDLSDMEPGQKTFVRQRSYSAGPIIDMPISSRKNFGTDRPEAALSNSDDPNDRPVLRYLIHLHICCPSKGRYFLYKGIRVVFANRVPDGKEKLRNEIQLPEPKYSTYKATRDSLAQQSTSSAASQLTAEKAFRRRSAGLSLGSGAYDRIDGLSPQPPLPSPTYTFIGENNGPSNYFGTPMSSMEPIPFTFSRTNTIESRPVSRDPMDLDFDSPVRHRNGIFNNSSSPITDRSSPAHHQTKTFDKLNKGDIGYGGNAFCGVIDSAAPTAGLLARKLRGLDVQRDKEDIDDVL